MNTPAVVPRLRERRLQVLGLAVAVLSLAWAVIAWAAPPPHPDPEFEPRLRLVDPFGKPRPAVILGQDGTKAHSDAEGITWISPQWWGTTVLILEADSLVELTRTRLVSARRAKMGIVSVVVPRAAASNKAAPQ